ncbi:MAG: putative lipid II flippase FtsW [Oscillospiraceae bacterium]|nr:putative lipid II flippase FtsW [Oscillospiraceae bacterium]
MERARLRDVEKTTELPDLPMLILSLLLTALGAVMIYSASFARALYETGDGGYFFKRELVFSLLGILVMLLVSRVRAELLRKLAFPILGVAIVCLVLVFVPGIGQSENGATRWIRLGISFQPSEIAKLGVILSFAALITRFDTKMETFRWGIAPFVAILGIIVVLLRLEPHNSAIVIIVCTAGAMLFLGGVRYRWFVLGGAVMLIGIVLILGAGGYEVSRITAWRDPFSDPTDDGYQIIQSLYAIGSGGVLGLGFGQGRQKYLYLPEEHNDYIFSIVCEELGLVGAVAILILYMLLILRGYWISMHLKDRFLSLTVAGITTLTALQVFFNIGVVTNLLPSTGISLPFFSYGGTALMIQLGEMGIILGASRKCSAGFL